MPDRVLNTLLTEDFRQEHSVKCVPIQSFSGQFFPIYGLNTEIHRAGRIDAMKVRKVSTRLYHDDSCHTLAKRHSVSECRLVGLKYSIRYVIQVFPKVSINGEWLAKIKKKRRT